MHNIVVALKKALWYSVSRSFKRQRKNSTSNPTPNNCRAWDKQIVEAHIPRA